MTWTAPALNIRPISRTAYGFDPRGQLVSEVNGKVLRVVHEAFLAALSERVALEEWKQVREQASQAWLDALNQTIKSPSPVFSEAWIKGTMHLYSTEFFFLADAYARALCGDVERYLYHFADLLLPASFLDLGKRLTLRQLYLSQPSVFQQFLPFDLRPLETPNGIGMEWRAASSLARLDPAYREEFGRAMCALLGAYFQHLPSLVQDKAPAMVSLKQGEGEIFQWEIRWQTPRALPRVALGGGLVSAGLLAATLATASPVVGVTALLPVVAGVAWEAYQRQRRHAQQAEDSLLAQMNYNSLQMLEMSAVYANLRSVSVAQELQTSNLSAMRGVLAELSTTFDTKRLLEGALSAITEILGFDRAFIFLAQREAKVFTYGALSHPPSDPTDLLRLQNLRLDFDPQAPQNQNDPLLGVWLAGKSLLVDKPSVYYTSRLNWVLVLMEFHTFYSVPLMLGEQLLGVVLADNGFTRRAISQEGRSLLDSLATNLAISLETARLYSLQDTTLKKSVDELRLIEQIDRELADTLDLETVLELLLDWGLRFTGASVAYVVLIEDGGQTGQIAAFYGDVEALPSGKVKGRLPLAQIGLSARTLKTGQPHYAPDVTLVDDYQPVSPKIRSHMSAPLKRQGRILGIMSLESTKIGAFNAEHQAFLDHLAARAGMALENTLLYARTQQEHEKLSAVLTRTADAVIVLDYAGRIVLLNNAALHILRLTGSPADFEERPFNELVNVPALHEFCEAMRQPDHFMGLRRELEVNEKFYDASAVEVEGVGYSILLHDVTPFKELERLKSEFVQTVSHDLKNPLAVIRGYVDLLETMMQEHMTAKTRVYLHKILRSVDIMQELIDNLLDLAKIETGMKLSLQTCSIPDLVEEVSDELRLVAQQKGIAITLDCPPDLPLIACDGQRIRQVLRNFISNAIKYTLEAKPIRVSVALEDAYLKVSVRDGGIGIAPEHQEAVWGRFARVRDENTKDIEGTGLGLAIVKSIIEAHSGNVGLESELGRGSTFWFTLPLLSPLKGQVEVLLG
jgi:signal transduction histidine kinase